jgi:hypothetical protein
MKRICLLAAVTLALTAAASAQQYVDIVHLKNGSVIRGVITEQVPGESLKIQTADGSVFVYAIDEVAKMTKEIPQPEPEIEVEVEVEETPTPTGPRKSPGAAAAWSLVLGGLTPIDGAGQFYNGEAGKGILFLFAGLVGTGMMVNAIDEGDDDALVAGAVVRLTSYISSAVDAHKSAKRINRESGWTTAREPRANSIYLGLAPEGKGRGGVLAFTHRM